ncbi:MAG: UbiA-like polyprenyltransferase [Symbiobacterium sp.]|uniref:UbiA-like polyprenyltransferase n=1 Tax=Symbiobacterium sp. TaxID=1971213 RepID=UPI003463953B
MSVLRRVKTIAELVKFEHTVLNLPFAYLGAFLAADGWPTGRQLFWITVALAGARTAAMAMNRLFDAEIDRKTPRTAGRHIPAGLVSRREVWGYVVVALAALLLAAANLHPLALKLFPLAVATFTVYPFTKRFTWLCHVWLGLSVSWGAFGAYIAVRGAVEPEIFILVAIITLWNTGFDIIYGTQDMEADRVNGVYSIPARFGLAPALRIARAVHLAVVLLVGLLGLEIGLLPLDLTGAQPMILPPAAWSPAMWLYLAAWALVAALLHYEHSIISPEDMSRVDAAFFNVNGYLSVAFSLCAVTALLLR